MPLTIQQHETEQADAFAPTPTPSLYHGPEHG